MGKSQNAILARHLRFVSRRYSYGKHTLDRLNLRYGMKLSNSELLEIAHRIQKQKDVQHLTTQLNGRQLFKIDYKGKPLFLIYDPYVQRVVTALPDNEYFKLIKLTENDKAKILNGSIKSLLYPAHGIVSIREGRLIRLYTTSSDTPFGEVRLISKVKVKVKNILKHAEGYDFKTIDDALSYLRERYGELINEETNIKIGTFSEIRKLIG